MDTRKAGAKYRSVGHGNLRTYLLPQYMRCLILTGTRIVPLLKSMHLYLLYTCISIGLPNMLGRSQRVRDQCSHINLINEGVGDEESVTQTPHPLHDAMTTSLVSAASRVTRGLRPSRRTLTAGRPGLAWRRLSVARTRSDAAFIMRNTRNFA